VSLLWIVLALVVLERAAELAHARRNTMLLMARGGIEAGRGHYPLIVLLHAAWLLALALTVPPGRPADWGWLSAFVALQLLRLWVIASLGPYWTTRIITLPNAALVRRGPYRYMNHPNYAVVIAEIAALPLAFGAWSLALVFSVLNAALIAWRIRVEDRVLDPRRGIAEPPIA